jgi:hypothetical protein
VAVVFDYDPALTADDSVKDNATTTGSYLKARAFLPKVLNTAHENRSADKPRETKRDGIGGYHTAR